jgi:DNA-binding NarL/FixJ family response regulator
MSSLMVVEDHARLGQLIVQFLESSGHSVSALAHSAEEALEQLNHVQIDLAIVDVSLPKMSGIELIRQMRVQFPDVRCLIFSGHIEPYYIQHALHAGAWGYVAKGEPDLFLHAVESVLAGEPYVSESLCNDG